MTEPQPTPPSSPASTPSSSAPAPLPQAAPQAAWPTRVETGEHQVACRHTVNAPAAELWAILADPHRHHEVDGTGSVKAKVSGPHRLRVGDRFTVPMKKYGLHYRLTLTATAVDEDRVVEWSHPGGHRWRWEFRDGGDGTCEVTEIFDYSWSRPAMRRALETARIPQANARGIQASLTRLAGRYL